MQGAGKSGGEGHIHTVRTGSAGRGKERASAEWYDRECADQRRVFEESEKHFHNDQSEVNRVSMSIRRNMYRKLCRNKKREYKKADSERLVELSKRDPKSFWREIRPKKVDVEEPDCDFFSTILIR